MFKLISWDSTIFFYNMCYPDSLILSFLILSPNVFWHLIEKNILISTTLNLLYNILISTTLSLLLYLYLNAQETVSYNITSLYHNN